ncbi:MAG: hypothetical protein ACK4M6_05975 [Hyphomonas sp.]
MSETKGSVHGSSAATRLRHEIDSGNTGDKVNYPDPAAAPLGTDDEAAGMTPAITDRDIEIETACRHKPQRRWIPESLGEKSSVVVIAGFLITFAVVIVWLASTARA